MTSAIRKDETRPKEVIPDVIVDPSSGKRYLKGRFLGKVSVQDMARTSPVMILTVDEWLPSRFRTCWIRCIHIFDLTVVSFPCELKRNMGWTYKIRSSGFIFFSFLISSEWDPSKSHFQNCLVSGTIFEKDSDGPDGKSRTTWPVV